MAKPNFKPTYDNDSHINGTVVVNYMSPLGTLETVVFNNVPPSALAEIKRIIYRYKK